MERVDLRNHLPCHSKYVWVFDSTKDCSKSYTQVIKQMAKRGGGGRCYEGVESCTSHLQNGLMILQIRSKRGGHICEFYYTLDDIYLCGFGRGLVRVKNKEGKSVKECYLYQFPNGPDLGFDDAIGATIAHPTNTSGVVVNWAISGSILDNMLRVVSDYRGGKNPDIRKCLQFFMSFTAEAIRNIRFRRFVANALQLACKLCGYNEVHFRLAQDFYALKNWLATSKSIAAKLASKLDEYIGAISIDQATKIFCLLANLESHLLDIEKWILDSRSVVFDPRAKETFKIQLLIEKIENASTDALKIQAFLNTQLAIASQPSCVFHPCIKEIVTPIILAIGGHYSELTTEALRVCEEFVKSLQPDVFSEGNDLDFKPYVHPIYDSVLSCLKSHDLDQEVKECAISCMGHVVSKFGDCLGKELSVCLNVLSGHLGNEVTQRTAIMAFSVIAASPLHLDLSCILDHVILELTALLRKPNRALRQATRGALSTLIVAYGSEVGSTACEAIVEELSTLISDFDLHLAVLALELCCMLMTDKGSGQTITNRVLPQAMSLLKSPLLEGQTLMALQKFFGALVYSELKSFKDLGKSLFHMAVSYDTLDAVAKQALSSIVQCVAFLYLAAGDEECLTFVKKVKDQLKTKNNIGTKWVNLYFALLCLGEIGRRRKDLSSHENIETTVIDSFQSPFEEVKYAASYALGNIAVGNLAKYLPFILAKIDNQPDMQCMLLHSLKEVIDKAKFDDSDVENITKLLFDHCENEEEEVRNLVAECLGKIALIQPENLVPALKERISSPAAFVRATVVIAVTYSIVVREEKIDEYLYAEISAFFMLIKDNDWRVRRAAVLALKTAAHNKRSLITELPDILPLLYDQTVIKEDKVGRIDDVLELRKIAFECVDTLLDRVLPMMNLSTFIVPFLLSGLDDHYDVKMPCHLILSKLVDMCPSDVLAVLDYLVDPLQKTINFRPKQDAVKQEVDRNEDMIRSALRAIASLNRISGGDCSHRFKNLISEIAKSTALSEKFSSIRNE